MWSRNTAASAVTASRVAPVHVRARAGGRPMRGRDLSRGPAPIHAQAPRGAAARRPHGLTSASGLRQSPPVEPRPRLSVLVPVYNEVATVRALLARVMAVPIPKEIIRVDAGPPAGAPAPPQEMPPA